MPQIRLASPVSTVVSTSILEIWMGGRWAWRLVTWSGPKLGPTSTAWQAKGCNRYHKLTSFTRELASSEVSLSYFSGVRKCFLNLSDYRCYQITKTEQC